MTQHVYAIESLSVWVGRAFGWCILVLTFSVSYEVFVRYVLNSPTVWVNEISRFLQIWATYLALTYTFHKKDFIRITVVYDRLNESGKKFLDFISE